MKKKQVSVNELMSLIPDDLLESLGEQTQVDYQVKKLTGPVIFKLLLYGLSNHKDISWRLLEGIFTHYKFKQFAKIAPGARADHSSLATRLANIKAEYFAQLYQAVNKELHQRYKSEKIGGYKIARFDSTLVSIAGTLLKKVGGMQHGVNKKCRKPADPVHIKFSVGFDGLSPLTARFFHEQKYLSEDLALKQVIDGHEFSPDEIAVFDRGLNKRDAFDSFTGEEIMFVTRLVAYKGKVRHEWIEDITSIDPTSPLETESLWIEKDQKVYLFNKASKKTKYAYRLIQARAKQKDEVYYFLTNEMDLSAQEVVLIYKYRWDIEVFFKFLKQEFGFKHFLSRNQNGIEVVLYMTLISFTLIYLYYRLNEINSFKLAKMQFTHELDFEVMKVIVEICKGDPNLLYLMAPS